jgi:hypothetical protein
MAFTQYKFTDDNCKRYKGIKYYIFSDCYIIVAPDRTQYKRFTVKDTKNCINDILATYKDGWVE